MRLGKLGVWATNETMTATAVADFAQRVEKWGYSALWVPEGFGRDALVLASWLLANTKTLNIATGIATIYARDPMAAKTAQHTLAEQSGGRFLLGLGVSHAPMVEGMRGHKYETPVPAMRTYLEGMQKAKYLAAPPLENPKTVIAALGPKMLEVATKFADGAHPYNVTPEHTARARKILGPGKLLCPEQKVLLETDASTARAIARRRLGPNLGAPNYRNSFARLGFTDADMDGGGSDRLIDAVIAWGDERTIRKRIQEHWDAGADHVCIQSVPREGNALTKDDEKIFELLAPG